MRCLPSLFALLTGSVAMGVLPAPAKYQKAFKIGQGQSLDFPDFTLTYDGAAEGPFYPGSTTRRLGSIHTFKIVAGRMSDTIKWSSGTGDIGPVRFKAHGEDFELCTYLPSEYGGDGKTKAGFWYVYKVKPAAK